MIQRAPSSGADSQIRTGDLILTKDALYRLSYISALPFDNVMDSTTVRVKKQVSFSLFHDGKYGVYFSGMNMITEEEPSHRS